MAVEAGQNVRLPCEVKPGPFSYARVIRIETGRGRKWRGLVPARVLRDPTEEVRTYVRTVVSVVWDHTLAAKPPGSAVTSGMLEAQMFRVERVGSPWTGYS